MGCFWAYPYAICMPKLASYIGPVGFFVGSESSKDLDLFIISAFQAVWCVLDVVSGGIEVVCAGLRCFWGGLECFHGPH